MDQKKTSEPVACKNCRFFEQSKFQNLQGICRRYPVEGNKHINEWCGEHQPKE